MNVASKKNTPKKQQANAASARNEAVSQLQLQTAPAGTGKISRALVVTCFFILFVNVFTHIQYPLFWADESMTVVGAERVLQFGYPKVHDGKNVFYDLRDTNPKLGIDEKTDAFIGGTNWGHYYVAAPAVWAASLFTDLYVRTGIIRCFFALIGILGIMLLAFTVARLMEYNGEHFIFSATLLLMCSLSIALVLLIREVRYYSLVIFINSLLLYFFSEYFFRKKLKAAIYCTGMFLSLFSLFMTFSPAYFIFYLSAGIFFVVMIIVEFTAANDKNGFLFANWKRWAIILSPFIAALLIALPFLAFFKTFAINAELSKFYEYSSKIYWDNFSQVWKYFSRHSIIYPALLLKIGVLYFHSRIPGEKRKLFYFSLFTSLYFVCYALLICRIPNFMFTRYYVPMEPLLFLVVLCDAYLLLPVLLKHQQQFLPFKWQVTLLLLFAGVQTFQNYTWIGQRWYEMNHQYKGDLDYTIPYIRNHFSNTKDLVIATNYEETAYMYYLDSKVIVGFVGNNLDEDKNILPDIIQFRESWKTHADIFNNYINLATYEPVIFPVEDNSTNNNPELLYDNPYINHQFKTLSTQDNVQAVKLYLRKK